MPYRQFPPHPCLHPHVRHFWVLEHQEGETIFKTVAEGNPGLIFHDAPAQTVFQNGKTLPAFFLFGQATRHADIRTPQSTMIGVSFHPLSLRRLFGMPAGALTDTCVGVDDLSLPGQDKLTEQLLELPDQGARIRAITAFLHKRLQQTAGIADAGTGEVVDDMIRSRGSVSLHDLRRRWHVSERTLERRFLENVGVSPKMFLRICGFQACLEEMNANRFDKLSDIAYSLGYADQSHFIRTFREFSGVSPDQYQRRVVPVSAAFSA